MSKTTKNNRKKQKISMRKYMPWIEKYRPQKIDDIAYQSHVVKTLKQSLEKANLPHLLFYGPAGTGKTSTILALAKQLYGPKEYGIIQERVLELNASDERGINVVREKIKSFAQYTINTNINKKKIFTKNNKKNNNYPCPPYKIIILDEADNMTRDAQTALRRTMEKYSNVTRFCLICNYVSRIIAPVASRCAKFRFQSLNNKSMFDKLRNISNQEMLKINDKTLEYITNISNGDMRKSITLLQSSSLMKPLNEEITINDVKNVSVTINNNFIPNEIIPKIKENNFECIKNLCDYIIAEGFPITMLLEQLNEYIIESDIFTDMQKSEIALNIANSDKCLVDGASEYLQLLSVLGNIQKNFKTK